MSDITPPPAHSMECATPVVTNSSSDAIIMTTTTDSVIGTPPLSPVKSPTSCQSPGVKDSDGFLTPPPASTLLIRRTRTSSTGPSTYVVSSLPTFGGSKPIQQQQHAGDKNMETDSVLINDEASAHSSHSSKKGKPSMESKESRQKKSRARLKCNIDPITGKRRYKKRSKLTFTVHKKPIPEPENPPAEQPLKSLTWRPDDDLRLVVNMLQTRDFKHVHLGVKFSQRYSLEDIKQRWSTLLYNKAMMKTSSAAILELHPKVTTKIFASALLSDEELKQLQQIKASSNPTERTFENLLQTCPSTFYKCQRTAKFLHRRWLDLKIFHSLDDQHVKDYFESELESFSDFEDSITDEDVRNLQIDPAFLQEFLQNEKRTKKKIRILEEEIARWQELSDLVWEGQIVTTPQFDDKTYAFIRGRNVRFAMAAKEITLGRRTKNNWVDADLSEEGSDIKVSRRQATIKMRTLGDFVLLNQGRHSMFVDGQAIFPGETTSLQDQSVITVSNLNFVFIVNEKLLNDLRKKIIEEEANAEHVEVDVFSVNAEDSDSGLPEANNSI